MKKNKFLSDLGIPIERYGTNFTSKKDKRKKKWKKERKKYGFDSRETWNLQTITVEWIYSRLKMYDKVNCVDTTYHKFIWNEKEITLQDAINLIIESAKEYLLVEVTDDLQESSQKLEEFCNLMPLFGMILPYLWW